MSNDDKKHLDFDLDFLDEKTKESPGRKKKKTPPSKEEGAFTSWNASGWKVVGGIVAFILFLVWIGSLGTDSPSSANQSPSTNISNTETNLDSNDMVVVGGEFRCSRHHYNQATDLEPDESEQQLSAEQAALDQEGREVENLAIQIENSDVTEYSSQYRIDEYNRLVDRYNSRLRAYNRKADSLEVRIDRFNRQVEAHNNYLTENCEPIEQ